MRPSSGTTMYKVDVTTRTATKITLSSSVSANDFAWAYGYLWGVEADTKKVVRIDVTTGKVTKISTSGVFPAADPNTSSPGYGAAWTYGNGNLAVSNSTTGNITQFTVLDPASASPTVVKVSTIRGPDTSRNDAATTPSSPTDLVVTVQQPEPALPSAPIDWVITVTNAGPPGSSGSVFSFDVPAGVTDVVMPDGCTLDPDETFVQCVTNPLPNGQSDVFEFSATAPPAGSTSVSSTITIVGNELDPVPGGATLTITPQPTSLTSTGVGTTPQTVTVAVPAGGQVTLLDADGDPTLTVTIPGQGTYAVDPATGALTFTPEPGFHGTATGVTYRVTDAYGQTTDGEYTAEVAAPPAPPALPELATTGGTPLGAALLAAGLLMAGASLLVLRRRVTA